MCYFLSPKSSHILYQTALRTPYLFTDDVFMGVLIKNISTTEHRIKLIAYSKLTRYADMSKEYATQKLKKEWERGVGVLFHLPITKSFWEWYKADHS